MIYGLVSFFTVIAPAIKVGPKVLPTAMNYAVGPFLASGVGYILTGAAINDRIESDTYKRQNQEQEQRQQQQQQQVEVLVIESGRNGSGDG